MPAIVPLLQRGLALSALLLCGCALARADVYVLVAAYDLEPLPDLEADFGPAVPSLGVEGTLRVADPHDACQPFSFVDFDTPWIALISRQQQARSMNCTFDIKVMHAQMAGASAAIVYDDFYESLIIMSMPKGHDEPSIPSVFVTERSGFILTKLLEVEGKDLRVRIMPVTTVAWLEALVSTLLGLMSITMVIASFYAMRSWGLWLSGNQRLAGVAPPGTGPGGALARTSGLPASAIHALPVIIYDATSSRPGSRCCSVRQGDKLKAAGEGGPSATSALEEGLLPSPVRSSNSSEHDWPQVAGRHAGETKRVCTICLEDYVDGEKIRVLPCLHRFHKSCVDQWLSSRRMCPVCKHDAGTPLAPPTAPAEGSVGGRQGVRDRLARMGVSVLSWMGVSTPASVDPAAELLLSRSPPVSPTHETARRNAPRLRQSRLWDLYLAYAALETEPPQGAAAATAVAAATGTEAEPRGDVEAGAAAAQAPQAAGQGSQGPAQALPLEVPSSPEAHPPALRSVREGPSPPIHIPAVEGAPAHVAAAADVDGQRQPGRPGAAAAGMPEPEPGSMPFPSTPPMQAPANPASRS